MKKRYLPLIPLFLLLVPLVVSAQGSQPLEIQGADIDVTSGGQAYKSYVSAPSAGGPFPGIVLVHSIRGMEPGYRTMTDQLAARGFVVLAIGWQTFGRDVPEATVKQILTDSASFLTAREDVDPARLGLTGFCIGGYHTMLFLPQMEQFKAGVAWYGFPNRGDTPPLSLVGQLSSPLLIVHGTADTGSPIGKIYEYANALTDAKKYFELKVYYGEPHGFMLQEGQLREDGVGRDAFDQMAGFFQRKLVEGV